MRINTHKKRPVNLYLNVELVEKAKELGLNISKVCENALKEAIRRLTQTEPKTSSKRWWTGRDLNPRPPPCEGGVHAAELPAREADLIEEGFALGFKC